MTTVEDIIKAIETTSMSFDGVQDINQALIKRRRKVVKEFRAAICLTLKPSQKVISTEDYRSNYTGFIFRVRKHSVGIEWINNSTGEKVIDHNFDPRSLIKFFADES